MAKTASIENVSAEVLLKATDYALKQYGVETIQQLKDGIVEAELDKTLEGYLDKINIRILRREADNAKAYKPNDQEIIDYLDAMIEAME